ncbi:MAG: TetR/AcrR family transcriptional regulator [Trueperaceae bacterium]|nr:TetR/AcrR family transcriptional regulator [Trueperaceae bacterium]
MSPSATREPLDQNRVLNAALALADREGLKAVTMRRLGADLGVEAMSLYHHLPGKDGLLDGLVGAVVAEIQAAVGQIDRAAAERDWRAVLRRRCLDARSVMLRHPWAPGLIGSRQTVPHGLYLVFEDALATMVHGGLSYHLGHRALHSLGSMLLGYVSEVFSPGPMGEGLDPDAAEADFAAMAKAVPHLLAMVESEVHAHDDPNLGWCDSQTEFEFTLDLLLDGLERVRTSEVR